jgi:SAM-dependent methyltransferase
MNPDEQRKYCEYLQRRNPVRRLVYRFLVYPRISRRLSGRVVDVGCGIGDFLAFRPGTVGVDINPCNVDFCRRRGLEAEVVRSGEFPFPDNSRDGAVMDNVLEHILDPDPVLGEIRRVLRPAGVLVVGVPGRRGYAHDPDHRHFYNEKSLAECVEGRGLFRLEHFFYSPFFKSGWLDRYLRQYCIYGVFVRA